MLVGSTTKYVDLVCTPYRCATYAADVTDKRDEGRTEGVREEVGSRYTPYKKDHAPKA